MPALSDAQLAQFVTDGFVRIDDAFPTALADAGRAILWADTGLDPDDPGTWTKPVIRLGNYGQQPFRDAANNPILRSAYDQLVGAGRWTPQNTLGTFPIRFPSPDDPGDAGWQVDVSFGWEENRTDFMAWRANITSKGHALLMLFLLSEVGEQDAPTRIRIGSHLGIARRLAPAGEAGLSLRELASTGFSESESCPQVPSRITAPALDSRLSRHCCHASRCALSAKTAPTHQSSRQFATPSPDERRTFNARPPPKLGEDAGDVQALRATTSNPATGTPRSCRITVWRSSATSKPAAQQADSAACRPCA